MVALQGPYMQTPNGATTPGDSMPKQAITTARTKRPAPKRIRKVVSVTLHPRVVELLDRRAAALGTSRSKMIERLATAHCIDDAPEHPETTLTVRYVSGSGFEIEEEAPAG